MHLLLITDKSQNAYLSRFGKLSVLHGHRTSVINANADTTLSEIDLICKKQEISGILCANDAVLQRVLDADPTFLPPTARKKLSLNDYQGSFLKLKGIDTVVINPPEHIMSVPYGAFIFDRFISKLTKSEKWFPQTAFEWAVAEESKIEEHYNAFATADIIGIDIETPMPDTAERRINCVSFTAYWHKSHTTFSLVIPFTSMYWLTWIRKFCQLPVAKVLQGGTYDAVRLLRFNVPISDWYYDTMALFHAYYSEMPKRLDFVAAYALRNIRFWKDDGKTGNLEDYYRYNALDGWGTVNSLLSLILEIPDWARNNYLQSFPLSFPSIHCELEGWRVDPDRFKLATEQQEKIRDSALARLRTMLGAPNYNPNSPNQNKKLFTVLGCGDLTSTDEAAMKKAEFRHPLNARVLGDIRAYKKSSKLISTYCNPDKLWKFDDKNYRLFYRINPFGTDTARLSSSESSFWLGYQIQNVKRGPEIKQYLCADDGWLLAEPDFEQSESRCTFYLAGEQKGIDIVESGKDFHCFNAQLFFGIPYEELWDEEKKKCKTPEAKELRDGPAKRTNHGANYNMTGGVMLDNIGPKAASRMKLLLNLPASMTLKQVCQFCLDRFSATYSMVKKDWYADVIKKIELTKKLVSPLGWTRHFFGDPRNNKHHLNAAVAHGPQNLSVGIINRGFYKIWWESIYEGMRGHIRIKAQIHDSVPYQYKIGSDWVNDKVRDILTQSVPVTGADGKTRNLVIPVGMSAGKKYWSELK